MKIIFITYIFAISLCCGENSKTKKEIKLNTIESKALINPTISSITFTNGEIIGTNHFGYKYDFSINISSSSNLDILSFCKENFSTILNGRVTDADVINSILENLNIVDNVRVDENPKGLRILGASTESFDSIEVEIFLKEGNLLKMDLKYYSPL